MKYSDLGLRKKDNVKIPIYIKDFSKVKFQTQIGDVNVKYLVNTHFGEYVKYPNTNDNEQKSDDCRPVWCLLEYKNAYKCQKHYSQCRPDCIGNTYRNVF